MRTHTNEPWIVTGGERIKYVEARIGNGMLQEIASCMIVEHGNHEENARRIVACVNMCEGIETEKIEGKTLEQYVSEQAFISGMTIHDGVNFGLHGLACQMLAASFAGQFKGSNAINYLEVGMSHPEIGPFIVTIQRTEGKTPHQFRLSAEQQRDELLEALRLVIECTEITDRNCSCHISPPCNDCVDNSGIRAAVDFANAAIAKAEAAK
jgi:hypothetical protein